MTITKISTRANRTFAGLILWLCATHLAHAEELTILYTNDIESVYEPVESFWRSDITQMGGMAHLSTLINERRAASPNHLLVDAGDMFTGSLSKATGGRLVFDIYGAMGYDAVNLGNHEFEYGSELLHHVMQRAEFPVLNANIVYENTDIPFSQQYTIRNVNGIRVGIIGIMGIDAFINTMMKANRVGLEVTPPIAAVQRIIDKIQGEVDFIIALTHQNRTAPMQTNKESDAEVQRGFDEDYALAGAVRGLDLIVGGHSDNGLIKPVIHPETGTAIVMTFGQGMHLGEISFAVDPKGRTTSKLIKGELIPVDAGRYAANPEITRLIDRARSEHTNLARVAGQLDRQAYRKYYRESPIGNLLADMLRNHAKADIGLVAAGAIRADFEAGDITVEEILNVFPFTDTVSVLTLSGTAIRAVLEKGLSLEYGLAQFSGVSVHYDRTKPAGSRVLSVSVNGKPLQPEARYTLVTGSFTATGGENYTMFDGAPHITSDLLVSDVFIKAFEAGALTRVPDTGRFIDVSESTMD